MVSPPMWLTAIPYLAAAWAFMVGIDRRIHSNITVPRLLARYVVGWGTTAFLLASLMVALATPWQPCLNQWITSHDAACSATPPVVSWLALVRIVIPVGILTNGAIRAGTGELSWRRAGLRYGITGLAVLAGLSAGYSAVA